MNQGKQPVINMELIPDESGKLIYDLMVLGVKTGEVHTFPRDSGEVNHVAIVKIPVSPIEQFSCIGSSLVSVEIAVENAIVKGLMQSSIINCGLKRIAGEIGVSN